MHRSEAATTYRVLNATFERCAFSAASSPSGELAVFSFRVMDRGHSGLWRLSLVRKAQTIRASDRAHTSPDTSPHYRAHSHSAG